MAIVTFGADSTSEVESYLGFKDSIDPASQEGIKLDVIIKSIEAWLKAATGRLFEETTYTTEIHDVEAFQRLIRLSDYPVTAFTLLSKVIDRDTAGVVTLETIEKDAYVVTRNRLESLIGPFPVGLQNLRATYTAGYTSAQITANSAATDLNSQTFDEVPIWKALELSIIAREWGLAKENKRHFSNINFGDESTTFSFDLDGGQRRLLYILKLDGEY